MRDVHIPELSPANAYTLRLWELVNDQIRVGFGGAYALDAGAVLAIFNQLGVIDQVWQLQKLREIFKTLMPKKKDDER